MYLARFCLVNCLLTLVRSHKCHEWNHRELIAIVETWSCWQKKKNKNHPEREPQQLDNKWSIIKTSMDVVLVGFSGFFLGVVGKLLIKRLSFFSAKSSLSPLSKAIWAHIFIVLDYKLFGFGRLHVLWFTDFVSEIKF